MKKIFYILFIFLTFTSITFAQKECCPKFEVMPTMFPCVEERQQVPIDTLQDKEKCDWYACKHTNQTYIITPQKKGYTFTWQVVGGTPATLTGSFVNIKWGIGDKAKIKIFISNADGSCKDTIEANICLQDAPTANFNFTPASPVCLNQIVQFTNTSIGATKYSWDFGDGSSSTQTNPSHTYTTPGTYTIVLAVTNYKPQKPYNGGGTTNPDFPQKPELECGCRDTIRKTITVSNKSGVIILPECKQMLCKGDTASYCTTNQCNGYNWSVTGGRILGNATGKCVKVVWDGNYPATLTMSGNCGGYCSNTGTIQVPVLYPTMPIIGNTIVCPNSSHSYSLPTMPGTFYKWKITGVGNTINGADSNVSVINVNWGNTTGNYTITCDYKNPITGCSGKGTINVDVLPPFKITGKTKYCVGNSLTYTANGNAIWKVEPVTGHTPATFPNGTSINGIWNKPGVYTITATPTSPNNFCSYPDVIQVTVLDTPKLNAIKGEILVCPNSSEIYSISSNMNAGLFYWSVVGGSITSYMGSHKDSVIVKWNATGPYSLQVFQTVKGCSSSPKKINIDVYKAPTVTGPTSVCMDAEAIYIASGIAPLSGYTWSLNNALGTIVSGQGTNTVKILWHGALPPAPTTCNVTVTTCGGAASITVNVIVPPAVTINKTGNLCSTTGITLSSSITGAGYAWQRNGVAFGSSTQNINITSPGVYTIEVNTGAGCKSKATIVVPAEKLNISASLSTTDKTHYLCTETVNTLLNAIPSTGGYCYQWYKTISLGTPGTAIGGATSSSYLVNNNTGYFYCLISTCGTTCFAITDTIKIDKESCGSGNGSCTDYQVTIGNSLCNPFTFTGSTTPAAAAGTIHWYFGDGDEGYGSSVTHQYKDTGNFKVCATFGITPYCRKDTCKIVRVTIAANFLATANCDKVTIINLCKAAAPVSYLWNISGGTAAASLTSSNPGVITYTAAGLHTISVTINDGNCSLTYSDTVRTYNTDATINIPTPICAKTNAPFTATSTNTNLTYQWNFGDGYISNLQNTTHEYATSGPKTVTLTVTDAISGCTKTYTKNITVLPAVTINIGTDKYVCIGNTTTLSASPSSFATYQWYKDGVVIAGATNATYSTGILGEYWVVASNGNGCIATSNKIKVLYNSTPIADIDDEVKQVCTAEPNFNLRNTLTETGVTYKWTGIGPGGYTHTGTGSPHTVTLTTPGEYSFVLTATNAQGCTAKDTICVMVFKSPTVVVTSPKGPLCEGKVHTFTATASPNIAPDNYTYFWTNGVFGNTMSTGEPGLYMVGVTNPDGCGADAITTPIKVRPNVSLFPVGCDTLCLTDTLRFPLPHPITPNTYIINWYDDDGTAIANVGTGFVLPLANLNPGIHHLYATVEFSGGCADTTGKFDLYVKDCTLLPPCDNCTGFFESASIQNLPQLNNNNATYQISDNSLTISVLKPTKEVRVSLADLKYYWKDTTCNNCKIQMIERGCLFPTNAAKNLGTLVWDDYNGSGTLPTSTNTKCPDEIVWKNGTPLMPGTYTVPLQLTLPKPTSKNCVFVLDKLCFHVTIIDTACKPCDKIICYNKEDDNPNCTCNSGNNWTSLYLKPKKVGIAKPQTQILCNSTLTDYLPNVDYTLSGVYHCQGGSCPSTKNEVVIQDQYGMIVYTHQSVALMENIVFPTTGIYTITLTAHCGVKKCVCSFRIAVTGTNSEPPVVIVNPPKNPKDPKNPKNPLPIDSVMNTIIPPDFNGGILVAQNDTVLYEKYVSFKDNVTSHTAFDLASITKTFTAMAVLKLMEEGKLNVDDAVIKYLPEFSIPEITVKMLLSHKSGLEDYLTFIDASNWDKNTNLTNKDLLYFISKNKNKVLIHTPGQVFDYSNTNFALLAMIIEKVSGSNYKDYLANTFFKPLQMDDTYLLSAQNFATATKSYYKNGKIYPLRYLDLVYGDKGVYSTVQDLKKWDKALRSGKMFKKSTLDLAYVPTSPLTPYSSNYGLGWKKITTTNGKEMLYHTGWWAGNRSILIRMPKENAMIAIVSNNNFTNINEVKKVCDLFGDYQLGNKKIANF